MNPSRHQRRDIIVGGFLGSQYRRVGGALASALGLDIMDTFKGAQRYLGRGDSYAAYCAEVTALAELRNNSHIPNSVVLVRANTLATPAAQETIRDLGAQCVYVSTSQEVRRAALWAEYPSHENPLYTHSVNSQRDRLGETESACIEVADVFVVYGGVRKTPNEVVSDVTARLGTMGLVQS